MTRVSAVSWRVFRDEFHLPLGCLVITSSDTSDEQGTAMASGFT